MALVAGRPGGTPLAPSLLWIAAGLALRAWAFAHLGGEGRTREIRPPVSRATGGPYRLLHHPVYFANLIIACGLMLAARPPEGMAWLLLVSVVVFYGLLADREERQLFRLPRRPVAAATAAQVVRSERSTWVVVVLFLLLSCC